MAKKFTLDWERGGGGWLLSTISEKGGGDLMLVFDICSWRDGCLDLIWESHQTFLDDICKCT